MRHPEGLDYYKIKDFVVSCGKPKEMEISDAEHFLEWHPEYHEYDDPRLDAEHLQQLVKSARNAVQQRFDQLRKEDKAKKAAKSEEREQARIKEKTKDWLSSEEGRRFAAANKKLDWDYNMLDVVRLTLEATLPGMAGDAEKEAQEAFKAKEDKIFRAARKKWMTVAYWILGLLILYFAVKCVFGPDRPIFRLIGCVALFWIVWMVEVDSSQKQVDKAREAEVGSFKENFLKAPEWDVDRWTNPSLSYLRHLCAQRDRLIREGDFAGAAKIIESYDSLDWDLSRLPSRELLREAQVDDLLVDLGAWKSKRKTKRKTRAKA